VSFRTWVGVLRNNIFSLRLILLKNGAFRKKVHLKVLVGDIKINLILVCVQSRFLIKRVNILDRCIIFKSKWDSWFFLKVFSNSGWGCHNKNESIVNSGIPVGGWFREWWIIFVIVGLVFWVMVNFYGEVVNIILLT
jgi:hypothetical protein